MLFRSRNARDVANERVLRQWGRDGSVREPRGEDGRDERGGESHGRGEELSGPEADFSDVAAQTRFTRRTLRRGERTWGGETCSKGLRDDQRRTIKVGR